MTRFEAFAKLHVAGDPLLLFNVWDAGSADAVAQSGAKAIATGSASVAAANGLGDGEKVPLPFALDNAGRIVRAVELPVTIDFEGGYASDPETLERNLGSLKSTGAVGCNFEDQMVGTDRLYSISEQAARIVVARRGAGADFFINARTDLFLKAPKETHDEAMADQALERAKAYSDAGANGFFVPLLSDLNLLERLCSRSPLPVNFMAFPNCPTKRELAAAGVARISHGPFPYRELMARLSEMARNALS